ncbi:MAG: hypothetical protein HYV32_05655 [Candidatus Kerfeldbacteria bacterium]|nr:hypothetical protein [Candidatus Kerfeldbacteria bacterium]
MAGTIEGVLYSFVWGGRTAESQEAQCELTVNGEITELAVAAVVWKDGQLVHVECELPDGEGVVVLDHSGESGPACRVWLFATTTVINDLRGNLEGVDSVGCEVVAP